MNCSFRLFCVIISIVILFLTVQEIIIICHWKNLIAQYIIVLRRNRYEPSGVVSFPLKKS